MSRQASLKYEKVLYITINYLTDDPFNLIIT